LKILPITRVVWKDDSPYPRRIKAMNYNPSTISRIADLVLGIRVDRTTKLIDATQTLFNVIGGRIALLHFLGEFTANATEATLLQINCNSSGSAVDTPLTGAGASLAAALIESKLTLPAAVGSNLTLSTGQAAALLTAAPVYVVSAGIIQAVIGTGNSTGKVKWSLWYVPIDDGAYVEAA
jgi:hypothetical protein